MSKQTMPAHFPLEKGPNCCSMFVYVTHSPRLQWGDVSNTGQPKIPRTIGQLALDGSHKVLIRANQQRIRSDVRGAHSTGTAGGNTLRHSRKLLREILKVLATRKKIL